MASLMKSVSNFLDTVIRRGGAAGTAQAAGAETARQAAGGEAQRLAFNHAVKRDGPAAGHRAPIPGLPPRPTKLHAPTADGRAPSSPDDIDPALLKELYRVGPALKKQEAVKPTAPATGEDAARRKRFSELRRDEEALAGRIAEADIVRFLDWRAAGLNSVPDIAGLAHALACDDDAAAALLRDYGVPQVLGGNDVKVGLWAPGDALALEADELSVAPVDDEPLPGRRRRDADNAPADDKPLPGRRRRASK